MNPVTYYQPVRSEGQCETNVLQMLRASITLTPTCKPAKNALARILNAERLSRHPKSNDRASGTALRAAGECPSITSATKPSSALLPQISLSQTPSHVDGREVAHCRPPKTSVKRSTWSNEYCDISKRVTYVREHNSESENCSYSNRINRGIQAEIEVTRLLESGGRTCVKQVHQEAFDILADGWRLDVKTAVPVTYKKSFRWLFNLHHGGRPITGCDFFVLRLIDLLSQGKISHALLGAPFKALTVAICTYALRLGHWDDAIANFDRFLVGDFGRCPVLESQYSLPEVRDAR